MQKINVTIDTEKEQEASRLRGSLTEFNRFFLKHITQRDYIIGNPEGREAHQITICRELTKLTRLESNTNRLIINVPPGYGKSLHICMWIAWCYAQYPDSNFLYISYSHTLAAKQTAFIKNIMQSRMYEYLFDVRISRETRAKDHFSTTAGGTTVAFGSSGAITGRDAGLPNLSRFSGAVVCFPYDELVHTDKGLVKIGHIVENKIKVNVYSYNFTTKKIELKPIQGWYKNPGDDILEVILNDGTKFECTPNHRIYTKNRGWVEAQNLTCSDKLFAPIKDSSLTQTKQFSSFSLGYSKVKDDLFFVIGQKIAFADSLTHRLHISFFDAFVRSHFTSSDFMNSMRMNLILFSHYFSALRRKKNIFDFFGAQSGTRMPLTHGKSSMPDGITHVVATGTITQVLNIVIKRIAVDMTYLFFWFLLTDKTPCHKTMNKIIFRHSVFICHTHSIVTIGAFVELFYIWLLNAVRSITPIINNPLIGSHPSQVGNTVKTIKTRNISPLLIRKIRHELSTYCINVADNHNFFVGKSEDLGTLVSNCDDMHKPEDIHSSTIRENVIRNYEETIRQRVRGKNVPIVFIGQRLHEDDLAAFLLSGKDTRYWDNIVLQALDDKVQALYPEVQSVDDLIALKEKSPYVFSSQYQQQPVPAGGGLFKRHWFVLTDEYPDIKHTFITVDTAETSKTYNDATAMSFWGVYEITNHGAPSGIIGLHWIDAIEVWIEPKDLQAEFMAFWRECNRFKVPPSLAAIEKKSTGVTLLSQLQDTRGIEIRQIERSRAQGSKTDRFIKMQQYIASRQVSINRDDRHTELVLEHMSKITANDVHKRDDLCDTCFDGVNIALIDKEFDIVTINEPKITEWERKKFSEMFS